MKEFYVKTCLTVFLVGFCMAFSGLFLDVGELISGRLAGQLIGGGLTVAFTTGAVLCIDAIWRGW